MKNSFSLASENIINGSSASSVSSRQSIKQKQVSPSDVSLPEMNQHKNHIPIVLRPSTPENNYPLHKIEATIEPKSVLDGFMLLSSTGMGFPNDCRQAILNNRGLRAVVEEDLAYFTGLIYLDVSENFLNIDCFKQIPKLKELKLTCNNIRHIDPLVPDLMTTTHSHHIEPHNQMMREEYDPDNLNAEEHADMQQGVKSVIYPYLTTEQLIELGAGYQQLIILDLSYNRLTIESVRALYYMKALTELDLTGNNLKNVPGDMYAFENLVNLNISRNKIQDNLIFISLSKMRNLRILNCSYNYLSHFPSCAVDGSLAEGVDPYRICEFMNLSFNYFGNDVDLQELILIPRLTTCIIYGNPVLGPTGQDVMKIYIEELCSQSVEFRVVQNGWKDLEFITEIPKKRTRLKTGEEVGRLAAYKGIDIVEIETDDRVEQKTGADWRKQGKRTLFGEAVEIAKQQNSNVIIPDNTNTFITNTNSSIYGEHNTLNDIATNVMVEVARSMNISSATELLLLKDQVQLPAPYLHEKRYEMPNEQIPTESLLYTRSMGNPQTMKKNQTSITSSEGGGLSMNAAIRSLRYALEHPLTNYTEVPSKGFLPPKDYVRPTVSSTSHKLPRIKKSNELKKNEKNLTSTTQIVSGMQLLMSSPEMQAQLHPKQNVTTISDKQHGATLLHVGEEDYTSFRHKKNTFVSRAEKNKHQTSKMKTLSHIEDVLDSLNSNTNDMLNSIKRTPGPDGTETIQKLTRTNVEDRQYMKKFAKPTNQIKGLVHMINQVADDLKIG